MIIPFFITVADIRPTTQIEQMWLLTGNSVYWINMKADIECVVKQCTICLEYQQMQPQEKVLHYEIPSRSWEVIGTD